MKDPYQVLRQKEQDAARVRKEIRALLTAIPMLGDPVPSLQEIGCQIGASPKPPQQCHPPLDADMDSLERYFPFVKKLQTFR